LVFKDKLIVYIFYWFCSFFVETILLFGYCIRRFLMSHAVIGACGDFLFVFRRNPYECA